MIESKFLNNARFWSRLLLVGLLFAGCAPQVDVAVLGPSLPPYLGEVKVFVSEDQVPGDALLVAQLFIEEGLEGGQQAMFEAAKIAAAELGADAILVTGFDQRTASGSYSMPSSNSYSFSTWGSSGWSSQTYGTVYGSTQVPYSYNYFQMVVFALRTSE